MLMLLLMTFGISGYVDPGYFNVGDAGNAGVHWGFFLCARFSAGMFGGAIVGIAHPGIRRLRWFLLLCAVLSAVVPGLLNADQRIFGTIAVLPARSLGFYGGAGGRDVSHDDAVHGTPSP
ncbi:hypothetical protein J4732_05120 [Serratia marcescens]|uniref:Uncharacterized protein n=1 Tax=Serratia marcescens TaxID=615 RepID=A0A939SV36_SERMA|nr:hypothetical protein [Serratia marcescens]